MVKGRLCFVVVFLLLGFSGPGLAAGNNIVKIGGDVAVAEKETVRNVVTVGGQITINGTLTGHALAIGGSVVLTGTALVEGNVVSVGGVIVMAKEARVYGTVREINASDISQSLATILREDWKGWSWVFTILSLIFFIGLLLLAILLSALLPKPVYIVSAAISESPVRTFLWGLLVLISIVPLVVLLTISVLGIVLIPLEMALVVCAALIGFIAVAELTGEKIFTLLRKKERNIISNVFLGLVVLWIIGWLPSIGWMIKVVALVLGLGGVFTACLGAGRKLRKPYKPEGGADGNEISSDSGKTDRADGGPIGGPYPQSGTSDTAGGVLEGKTAGHE